MIAFQNDVYFLFLDYLLLKLKIKTFQRFSGDKTFKDFRIYIRFVSAPLKHPKTNQKQIVQTQLFLCNKQSLEKKFDRFLYCVI